MISPEVLRRYPHFANVPDECLKSVASISNTRKFKAKERLFEESGELKGSAQLYEKGEEATHLLLLTEGEVNVVFDLPKGEEIVVDTLVPGDLMAIAAIIPPYRLTATGVARSDGELIEIEAKALRKLLDEVPELGYALMSSVAKTAMSRLNEARVQLASLT